MTSLFRRSGISGESKWLIFTLLVVSCYVLPITCAGSMKPRIGVSSITESNTPTAKHVSRARLLSSSLLYHKPKKQHSSLRALSRTLTPYHSPLLISQPPSISHLIRPSTKRSEAASPLANLLPPNLADISPTHPRLPQPALSPEASSCCGPSMVLLRDREGCSCVYPIKIDLLLTNVSESPKWELFLEDFASGLGLHGSQIQLIDFYWLSLNRLNISMDITPSTGISFSASNASSINSVLSMHKVNIDTKLAGVGDYKLLNMTWFEAPAPSPAPVVAASPAKAPAVQLPTTNSSVVPKKGGHRSLILVTTVGGFILISAIVVVLIICSFSTHSTKPKLISEEPAKTRSIDAAPERCSLPHPSSTRFLSYEELKQATNNFETACILGEGGFGKVFKGVLSDGTAVAIKRLTNGGQQGDKEFLVEVEMLSRLHHRNLVKLVGYYSSRDSSQNLLCYELVSSGSLESWLHGPLGVNCPLDWDTRMKIALDAARGLAYLHEDSQPCVIHRDFKASNILLENNFHAKVADFGLAKLAPEGQANYLSTRVMGTFGYVAPEYAMTGHLLVKSDVYSYGVVLLELLTGRKPVDMSQPSGQENLVTWTRPVLRDKERLEELADPKLQGNYPKEDFDRVCTIAAACVAPEPHQRPTMSEVVQSLKMVQRLNENQDPVTVRPNLTRQSCTFDSDGTSSMFSSGPFSGLSAFDNDNVSRTAMFSEDLHEGRGSSRVVNEE